MRRSNLLLALSVAFVAALAPVGYAQARDFFSSFFSSLSSAPERPAPTAQAQAMPFAAEFGNLFGDTPVPAPRIVTQGAYCVRTCDGRYFPLTGAGGNQNRASTCNSLCPASETKVFYGSTIDNATADGGKLYSSLTNAFRYRNEIVADCTCNGKSSFGLAHIKVENDTTIRRGDLVANENGKLVAANGDSRRGVATNFSPVSRSARLLYRRAPQLAAQ
jgi:hypothetical protein